MAIGYGGGSQARTPYEEQVEIERAFVAAEAMLDQEHDGDGRHTKPLGELTVTGDTALASLQTAGARTWDQTGGVYQVTLTGTTHNLRMPDGAAIDAEIIRADMAADRTLTGIAVDDANVYQRKYLINRSAFVLSLSHNSGSSTSGYRFATPDSGTFALGAGGVVALVYDGNSNVWRVESVSMATAAEIADAVWDDAVVPEADRTVTVASIPSVIAGIDHYESETANFDGSGIADVTVSDIGTASKALLVMHTQFPNPGAANRWYFNSTTTVRIHVNGLASGSATVAFSVVRFA